MAEAKATTPRVQQSPAPSKVNLANVTRKIPAKKADDDDDNSSVSSNEGPSPRAPPQGRLPKINPPFAAQKRLSVGPLPPGMDSVDV